MTNQGSYPDIFSPETTQHLFERLDKLTPETKALWGKMNVAQMLAHCAKPYEQSLEGKIKAPPAVMKFIVKLLYKKSMTNTVAYKKNLPTNPHFAISNEREFENEKNNLKNYIRLFEQKGSMHFEGKKQATLGTLNATEWNNLMYKHIDHHLTQFGV